MGLSGFSNTSVWLIFAAFMFDLGYEKSGLGKRVALQLVKLMGKRTLTLGYAVTIADLIIAPFTPSNTARSGLHPGHRSDGELLHRVCDLTCTSSGSLSSTKKSRRRKE